MHTSSLRLTIKSASKCLSHTLGAEGKVALPTCSAVRTAG